MESWGDVMKASEWVQTIPKGKSAAREEAILQAVKDRNIVVDWNPIYADVGGTRALFIVSNALQVGERGDSVRVFTNQRNAQRIADELNATLPTQRIADLMYHYAEQKIGHMPSDVGDMSTDHMVRQSKKIDAVVDDPQVLVANEGKFWLTHSKLATEPIQDGQPSAVNYGWFLTRPLSYGHNYQTTLPGILTVQGPYTGHGWDHEDYSQYVYLVARRVEVCAPAAVAGVGQFSDDGYPCSLPDGSTGVTRVKDIYEMIDDPQLKQLFTAGDPSLNFMRHPSVDWESDRVMAFDPFPPGRPGAAPWPSKPPDYPPGFAPAEPRAGGLNVTGKTAAALVGGGVVGYLGTKLLGRWWSGD
jgi:hypothetical protein